MSTGLAIVAIPSQDDYVWKISSEKVPHLTLLFLGDQNDTSKVGQMADFLEHVVETSMYRFGLDVDRRGTLGDHDADVLFFKNPGYSVKMLHEARAYLLNNRDIFEAYNSTEQFPTWLPHLTLGYPESPAKTIDRDYPITWVTFDRIALWTGDYEGPEFLLKDRSDLDMVMSDIGDIPVSDLMHFGVKGMKWGVRKSEAELKADRSAKQQVKADKKLAKADKKWEKKSTGYRPFVEVHNATAARMNKTEIDRINNMPQYKGKNFLNDSPLRRKYYKEYTDTYNRIMIEEHRKKYGVSPSGTKGLGVGEDGELRVIQLKQVKHADDDYDIKIEYDNSGHIVSLKVVETAMSQSNLMHYGVKGMKWGVRRERDGSVHVNTVKELAGQLGYKTSSTKKDYQRQVRAAGGLHKLSDKQLKAMNERLNMEKKFRDVMSEDARRRSERRLATIKVLAEVGQVVLPLAQMWYSNRRGNDGPIRTHATLGRNVIDAATTTDLVRR